MQPKGSTFDTRSFRAGDRDEDNDDPRGFAQSMSMRAPTMGFGASNTGFGASNTGFGGSSTGFGASNTERRKTPRDMIQEDYEAENRPALEVEIIRATDLMIADIGIFQAGSSDPYCHVELSGKTHTRQTTAVIDKNLNPEWNEVFQFKDYEEGDGLHFEVWDKDPPMLGLKSDDLLGKCSLDPHQVLRGYEGEILLTEAGDKEGKAKIFVKVQLIDRARLEFR